MAIYTNVGSGGILLGSSTVIQTRNLNGAFRCLSNQQYTMSRGQFVLSYENGVKTRSLQGGRRNGAYVAAVTMCKYDLAKKVRTTSNSIVKSIGVIPPKNTSAIAHGGSKTGGRSPYYGLQNLRGFGGAKTGSNSRQNSIFNHLTEDGVVVAGDAQIGDDFIPMFNGTFFLNHDSPDNFPSSNSPRTILGWVRTNVLNTNPAILFGYGMAENNSELLFNVSDSNFGACYGGLTSLPGTISTNKWSLVGFTYDGNGGMRIHVWDDTQHIFPVSISSLNTMPIHVRVGFGVPNDGYTSLSNMFIGDIHGVGVWNRQLTDEEVGSYFYAGRVNYSSLPSGLKTPYVSDAENGQAKTIGNFQTSTSNDIVTSNGAYLQFGSIDDIVTSSGRYLQFGTSEEGSGLISFWNLTEQSGTRHDSVSDNHLNEVDLSASFTYTTPVGRGNTVVFTDTSPVADNWNWDFGDDSGSSSQSPTHAYSNLGTFTITLAINDGAQSVSHNIVVEEPVASFTNDSPATVGSIVLFADTSTFAVSWLWDFGDGNTSTQQNPSHIYENAGTYTVSLQINGNISNTSSNVTINETVGYIWQKIDLSSTFNVIGLVPYGSSGESGSGLDGSAAQNTPPSNGSSSIDSTNLHTQYPNPIVVDGVHFNLNLANSNNTIYCNGQTIDLSGGCFDFIYMLGFGTNNGTAGGYASFVVNYSDASSTTVNLQFSDWFTNNNFYANETVALGGSNNIRRSDTVGPVYIFKYTLAIDRTKNAVSLTLPVYNNLDIFAISTASRLPQTCLWVSADQLSGFNNGDSVSTWSDLSGHGNNLSSSSHPTFVTNAINGLPALHFTAGSLSGDSYTTGQYMTTNATALGNYSVIALVRQSSPTGKFKVAVSWGGGAYNYWCGYIPDDSSQSYPGAFVPASDSHNDIHATYVDDTDWHIGEGIFNGTHLSGWATTHEAVAAGIGASGNSNGGSSALSGTTVTVGCYYGNSIFWNGDVAEVILFNSALSDSDRQVVESYLIYKYGLESQNEIQTLSFSPTPTGGTYTITVNGQTTGSIPFDSNATNVQSYINTALGADDALVS